MKPKKYIRVTCIYDNPDTDQAHFYEYLTDEDTPIEVIIENLINDNPIINGRIYSLSIIHCNDEVSYEEFI